MAMGRQGRLWCLLASVAAQTVDLSAPLTLGTCSCDLTQAQCDVNCCCDPDCGVLKDTFSCLPEGPASSDARYCYSKSWLRSVNPRVDLWVITDDLRGLLCVSVDNSAVQGQVFQNQALLSSAEMNAILEEGAPSTVLQDQAPRGYRAGDALKVHFAILQGTGVQVMQGAQTLENSNFVEAVRPLSLPSSDAYGGCSAGQAARFLVDVQETSCWQKLEPSRCSELSPRQLLGTWMLRRQYLPEDARCQGRCLLPSTCLVHRIAVDGSVSSSSCDNSSIPQSSLQSGADGCTCSTALRAASYVFYFSASVPVSITRVDVNYSVQDVYSPGCQRMAVQQAASVRFVQDQAVVEARSGNPGYVAGLPLLLAPCVTVADGRCEQYGDRQPALVPGIGAGGSCVLSGNGTAGREVRINFAENAIFGCTLLLNREELKQRCVGGAGFTSYLEMLPLSNLGTQIAAFGNIPLGAQAASDWVQVEERPRSEVPEFSDAAQRASNSSCTGAVVGVDLEVVYSPFGEVGNPQMKVVGARLSHRLGVLSYTLSETTQRQQFQFTYRVTFRETSTERRELQVPPRPQLPLSLPPDLFYPFTIGGAKMASISVTLMLLSCSA